MKHHTIIFFLCVFTCQFLSCSTPPDKQKENIEALEIIRKEKGVFEAIITDANVCYVAVKSDGTNRNGLAEYYYNIFSEKKATCKWVKIVEAGTTESPLRDNAYGILLGQFRK